MTLKKNEWPRIFLLKNEMAIMFSRCWRKIYKPCWRRQKKVTSPPVMEAKLEAVVDRVNAEILERFPNGVKIWDPKCRPNMVLQASEYAIAGSWPCGLSGILALGDGYQLYDYGKLLNKDKRLSINTNKDSDVFNCNGTWLRGLSLLVSKMLPKHM